MTSDRLRNCVPFYVTQQENVWSIAGELLLTSSAARQQAPDGKIYKIKRREIASKRPKCYVKAVTINWATAADTVQVNDKVFSTA